MSHRLIALGLVAAACGGSPAPRPEAATSPASPPPPVAAQPASPPVNGATVVETKAPASPFFVVGEVPPGARIFGTGERAFVSGEEHIFYTLVGDDVVHDPLLERGMPDDSLFYIEGIAGSWPDSAWLATTHAAGRSGFSKIWRWDGKRWVHRQSLIESRFIFGIRNWTGGRQLALEQAGMMFDASFLQLSGPKDVTLPAFARNKNVQSFCYTALMVQAFETLPSGEVFTAGQRCSEDMTEGLGVVRWAPGVKNGTIDSLPNTQDASGSSTNLTITGMAVRSPTDVYVSAAKALWNANDKRDERSAYLAHFDGSRWQEVSSKVPGVIESLATSSDGTLLVANDRGELYSGSSFDALTPLPTPSELAKDGARTFVASFWLRAPGDLWAVVNVAPPSERPDERPKGRSYLLHTRAPTKALPTNEEYAQKERAFRLPGPPVDSCVTPFVLLYTLSKRAPADYDYPSTRAALKGKKEFAVPGVEFIEFERSGQRFFGARVPDFTLGKKLMSFVKEKVAGSTPELVCHDPPPLRKLTLDLTGGTSGK